MCEILSGAAPHQARGKENKMNTTIIAEAEVTNGRPCLNRQVQGSKHVVQVPDLAEATAVARNGKGGNPPPGRPSRASFDGEGGNVPSGATPSPEGLRVCVEHDPTERKQAPTPATEKEKSSWEQVQRKWKKLDETEMRTGILWGAPAHAHASQVTCALSDACGMFVPCRWRGAGEKRHMVADFGNAVLKAAKFVLAKEVCKSAGLKLVDSRRWSTRARHRQQPKAGHTLPCSNRFGALALPAVEASTVQPSQPPQPSAEAGEKGESRPPKAAWLKRSAFAMLKVGAFNIQGGLSSKLGELDGFLGKHKYDAVTLQKTRHKKNEKIVVKVYKAYCQDLGIQSGPDHGGVVILVADHLVAFVSREPCTAADQLWVRISGSEERGDLLLCSAYMPQESRTREVRVEAFESLEATATRFQEKGHAIAICGDLNARLGSPKDADEERLLGRHGEPGGRSGNGRLTVDLMKRLELSNSGGQQRPPRDCAHKEKFWFTRQDPVFKSRHAIDFILTSKQLECKTHHVHYGTFSSDHSFLGTWIRSPRDRVRRRGRKAPRRRFKLESMIPQSSRREHLDAAGAAAAEYQKCLSEAFAGFEPGRLTR